MVVAVLDTGATPDEPESSNYKSGGMYGEFEYKNKKVEKEKSYYTGKQLREETTDQKCVVEETINWEKVLSLEVKIEKMEIFNSIIYLTILKEVLTLKEKKEFTIGESKMDMENLIKKK
ncbi:9613_t:CDS:2 [Acaulospora morrowiae]|uniref:9613_t:CDS:1 n=1 Tax=Acaulospora morrowiae TaxID=94023 RepID=A0A9N8ZIF7_9GLOM|nr:9613_t:CDS:2 [Acaulospora morrowiae]